MISAKGAAGTSAPQRVAADGAFCLEVRLIENAQNSVTFTPLDDRGCPGKTKLVTLRHQSAAGSDAAVAGTANVALRQPIKAQPLPEDAGDPAHVNDGNLDTAVTVKFWDWDIPDNGRCDAFAYFQIDFGKSYTITQVNLHWGKAKGAPYATCYAVLLSKAETPGEPTTTGGDWIVAEQKQDAQGEPQLLKIDPEVARHAAVLLYENASSGITEDFSVAEIEVLGQDPNAVPQPSADRCE